MKKLMMLGAVGLLLAGCANSPPPSMVDPTNPEKAILTPEQRNIMAITTLVLNPGVTFTEASISQPQNVGAGPADQWLQYRVCVRWRGTGTSDGDPSKYHQTAAVLRNAKPVRSNNPFFDPCSALGTPNYQPLPELLTLQDKLRKARTSAADKKR